MYMYMYMYMYKGQSKFPKIGYNRPHQRINISGK